MQNNDIVAKHYVHGDLISAIQDAVTKLGKTTKNVSVDDLGPVDEFHIGGRIATDNFLSQLQFNSQNHVLDIGCGLGGAARYTAQKYKSRVTGIDLTEEYIRTGNVLTTWVNMQHLVTLKQESALAMSFSDNSFDGAYMLHVGMNIQDKVHLFREIFRVLQPGSLLGVYDIMQNEGGPLTYPLPWTSEGGTNFLSTADQYKKALKEAGFQVSSETSRRDFALEFFKNMKAKNEANGGPPALGLHTLMKDSTPVKLKNMYDGIAANYIMPIEIICQKG